MGWTRVIFSRFDPAWTLAVVSLSHPSRLSPRRPGFGLQTSVSIVDVNLPHQRTVRSVKTPRGLCSPHSGGFRFTRLIYSSGQPPFGRANADSDMGLGNDLRLSDISVIRARSRRPYTPTRYVQPRKFLNNHCFRLFQPGFRCYTKINLLTIGPGLVLPPAVSVQVSILASRSG